MKNLEAFIRVRFNLRMRSSCSHYSGRGDASALLDLVRDASRFIVYHKQAIQISPLQTYVSALIFSPTNSLIRCHFKKEEPNWITRMPPIEENWSPCSQTLEGHSSSISSGAFPRDSSRLASTPTDGTVCIAGPFFSKSGCSECALECTDAFDPSIDDTAKSTNFAFSSWPSSTS